MGCLLFRVIVIMQATSPSILLGASVGGTTYTNSQSTFIFGASGAFAGGPNQVTGQWREFSLPETSIWFANGRRASSGDLPPLYEVYAGVQFGQVIHSTRIEFGWDWTSLDLRAWQAETFSADAHLTLPQALDAIVEEPTSVIFENLIKHLSPDGLRFEVECDIGAATTHGWSVLPAAADVGDHVWTLKVYSGEEQVDSSHCIIRVLPAGTGAGIPVRMLMIGDSLTEYSLYPNKVAARCAARNGLALTLLGTRHPQAADSLVFHEGYGGWTWYRFLNHFEPQPDPAKGLVSSPFVFPINGQPTFDVRRYYRTACKGEEPDLVTILLGVNDCISLDPADPSSVEAVIEQTLDTAEMMVRSFCQASPKTHVGICLTLPPNGRESAFSTNYDGLFTRKRWKPVQHRLVQKLLARFDGRDHERIFIVPTGLNVSPQESYPFNNAIHPNDRGYGEIASSIHRWMLARFYVGRSHLSPR